MQPLSGNQRPDLLTSLRNMSFVLRLPRIIHLCRSSSNVPRLPSFLEMRQNPHVLLTFDKVHNPLHLPHETTSEPLKVARTCDALYILTSKCASRHNGVHWCTFSTSQLPKVVREWGALCILTWKCASRHNGVHFFDISTSKSGPNMVCFVHFDLEMCFAPEQRALFRHHNFQKWSGPGVLYILTLKCASRHNGVHFFDISTSKSGPTLRCFVHFDFEMCFAPQRRALFHLSPGQMAPHPPL